MGYEQISLRSFIKEIKEVTDGAHPRKFCFVIGAGASRTSGIKSGQELVTEWDNDIRERNETEYLRWRKELGITDKNMSSFYSQYYDKRFFRCRRDGYNFIEKLMDSAKPSAGYVMLAHLLTTTPHNVVITTNFDHLTEDAVNYYAQSTPLVIGHESLAHYVSGNPVRPTIIKIHRDLLYDPKSNTDEITKLHDNWSNALELIFENYHPVFIGYAGNDPSLMDFLLENSNKFANDTWKFPYWLLYKSDILEGKVKDFLQLSNGYCIYHDGFDNVMIWLGGIFDYIMPTEEQFLVDARKRYKTLAEAIDALSDFDKKDNTSNRTVDNTTSSDETVSKSTDPDEDKSDINQAIDKITSKSERQKMYRDSINFYNQKNYSEAAKILKKLVEIEPTNARYQGDLGKALRFTKKAEDAIPVLRKAIELEPENDDHHFYLAQTLEFIDKPEDALLEYEEVAKLSPNLAFHHYKVADMYVILNQYENALESINKAISIEPNDPEYHDIMSEALRGMGRHKEAAKAAKKATDLRKQN